MLQDLYEFKKNLDNQGIFFCFNGPISQDIVTDIGAILVQQMNLEKVSKTTVIRTFSMLVEKAQNIIHYSDEKSSKEKRIEGEQELSHGIIVIGYEDGHYWVLSGNIIESDKVERLRKKLTKLQRMNKDELKEYYREQRRKEPDKGSKGAGLGFIEMAKRASYPIEFEFKQIDKKRSFFSLKTVVEANIP
jgi:hypothetical protein